MRLVKLDAIDSTNDFLKDLARHKNAENFTVVTAENQTKGKGQMGAVWNSEIGKNLIMSVLVKDFLTDVNDVFNLNIAVALAVIRSLESLKIPNLSIKWPNDIMSADKKVGGILIENSFKSNDSIDSIVGIGINVNQTYFENLPQASSLALQTNTIFDKEALLFSIVDHLKSMLESWETESATLKDQYTSLLFKKDVLMPFQKTDESIFMGTINGITATGQLEILSEDGSPMDFDIKEVKMIF
ncbi:biotin--[acetyl-CoA-carboxylase] ligase [Flavobacterium sp.]|uniref:biotin--[acetyl-CoA-carboxylase] ligase n=1 Tax=Flavobacterium sp. TaxID=239 RepID=UPI00262BD6FA|nr:biotin--[acetyl-CoA-carboxylase] ligase [Flavobacterium sp.]